MVSRPFLGGGAYLGMLGFFCCRHPQQMHWRIFFAVSGCNRHFILAPFFYRRPPSNIVFLMTIPNKVSFQNYQNLCRWRISSTFKKKSRPLLYLLLRCQLLRWSSATRQRKTVEMRHGQDVPPTNCPCTNYVLHFSRQKSLTTIHGLQTSTSLQRNSDLTPEMVPPRRDPGRHKAQGTFGFSPVINLEFMTMIEPDEKERGEAE